MPTTNLITGTTQADVLLGASTDDQLQGLDGDDVLFGLSGNDVLDGGAGNDVLSGGQGEDTYYLDANSGFDTVIDQNNFGDRLFLRDLRLADIRFSAHGNNLRVQYWSAGQDQALSGVVLIDQILYNAGVESIVFRRGSSDVLTRSIYDVRNMVSNVQVVGTSGQDQLSSSGNSYSTMYGLDGNDVLTSTQYGDYLIGGAGDDRYRTAGSSNRVIEDADDGIDTVESYDTYSLPENVENLEFYYRANYSPSYALSGTGNALNNRIDASRAISGVIYLRGGDGQDVLIAGAAGFNDLDGGRGADEMTGSALGRNTFYVDDAGDVLYGFATAINVVKVTASEYTLPDQIHDAAFSASGWNAPIPSGRLTGNALNNRLEGNSADDQLFGGDGNDQLVGANGDDVLDGGVGDDALEGGYGKDKYVVSVLSGNDTITEVGSSWDPNTLSFVDLSLGNLLFSKVGRDLLIQVRLTSSSEASSSVKVVNYEYGGMIDRLEFVNGGIATQVVSGAQFIALVEGRAFYGSDASERFEGTSQSDMFYGGRGDDTYVINNTTDGVMELPGEGVDTAIASVSYTLPDNVENLEIVAELNGSGGAAVGNSLNNQIFGSPLNNTLQGVGGDDELFGREGMDTLEGGEGRDILWGGDGDDSLYGGAGIDFLNGGNGNDTYLIDSLDDIIIESPDQGVDVVRAWTDYVLPVDIERLYLEANAISGSGNGVSNLLYGNATNNWLGGGDGNDEIYGGYGNDTLQGDAGNDELYGEWGDDVLDGGTGDDVMTGGVGNDTYIIRDLGDRIIESSTGWTDTAIVYIDNYVPFAFVENVILADGVLSASGSSANNWMVGNAGNNFLGGGLGHDALFGYDGDDYLKGDDGDDRLEAGAGDDVLEGNVGVDTMVGGDGNDTYYVDGPGDIIVETTTGGVDTVYSTGFYTLSENLENLVIIGEQAVNGTGDAGSNWMRGNANANVLSGAAGNDAIYAGDGADTLQGGTGDDWLDGEGGSDTYVYALGDGADVITNNDAAVDAIDTLTLTGIARSLLSFSRAGDNLVIQINDVGSPGSVTVNNWFAGAQHQIDQVVDADGARAAAVISALAAVPVASVAAQVPVMMAEAVHLSV